MNGDPFRTTTREEIERVFGADLDRDEESHIEEMEEERPAFAWLFLGIAIVLACLIGLAGCTDTAARDDLAPLTSPRPEARP